jgi:hypothetical protein
MFWTDWPQVHIEDSYVGYMVRSHRNKVFQFFGKKEVAWNVESYDRKNKTNVE